MMADWRAMAVGEVGIWPREAPIEFKDIERTLLGAESSEEMCRIMHHMEYAGQLVDVD